MSMDPSEGNLPPLPRVNCTPYLYPIVKNPGRQSNWITIMGSKSNGENRVFRCLDCILICLGKRGVGRGSNCEERLIVESLEFILM